MDEKKEEIRTEKEQEVTQKEEAEEIETAKDKKPEEKMFTQAEVNEIIESRLARERKKAEDEKTEAEKLAKMSAEEKANYKLEKLQRELETLQAQNARSEMIRTARDMLRDEGIDLSDDLVGFIVSTKAEETKENIQAFSKAYKRDLDRAVKEALKGKSPKIGTHKPISKNEILSIKDPMERKRAIARNLELFN